MASIMKRWYGFSRRVRRARTWNVLVVTGEWAAAVYVENFFYVQVRESQTTCVCVWGCGLISW